MLEMSDYFEGRVPNRRTSAEQDAHVPYAGQLDEYRPAANVMAGMVSTGVAATHIERAWGPRLPYGYVWDQLSTLYGGQPTIFWTDSYGNFMRDMILVERRDEEWRRRLRALGLRTSSGDSITIPEDLARGVALPSQSRREGHR